MEFRSPRQNRTPPKTGWFRKLHAVKNWALSFNSLDISEPSAVPNVPADALPNKFDSLADYSVERILTPKEKDSMSYSTIFFGRHLSSGQLIAGKVFVDYTLNAETIAHVNSYNTLLYEACVYEQLTKTKMTNIVRWITTLTLTQLPQKLSQVYYEIPFKLRPYVKGYTILITERRYGAYPLRKQHFTDATLKNLLFQIVFALIQANYYGFQHNDLHLGNILVDTRPREKYIEYTVRGQTYTLDVQGGKVLLFDWDHGVCHGCGRNKYLDDIECPKYGICNEFNNRFDLYMVLREFRINTPAFTKFYKELMPESIIPIDSKFFRFYTEKPGDEHSILESLQGRMCNFDLVEKQCVPFPSKQPSFLPTPIDIIQHAYFSEFKRRLW